MRRLNTARALVVVTLSLGMLLAASSLALANTESGYVTWTADAPNNTSLATPHKDYQTTTQKCAVCHAVHKAPADGELLLRGLAGDSCVYCHITNNTGFIQIYNGNVALYNTDNTKNHSRDGGAPCTGCHAVHGANTYGGEIATKILKRLPIQPEFVRFFTDATDTPEPIYSGEFPYTEMSGSSVLPSVPNQFEGWGSPKTVQQTAFCTGCHPYFTRASEESIETSRMVVGGAISTETTSFSSHPMKRAWDYDVDGNKLDSHFEAAGSTLPSGTVAVAFMSTNGCFRCHGENEFVDANPGLAAASFPHYTPDNDRFLVSADDSGGQQRGATEDSKQDGTCFPCHMWDDGSGVGRTY